MKKACIILLFLISIIGFTVFIYTNSLTYKIQRAIQGKDCMVSVAVSSKYGIWSFNNKKVPLMSVFKIFIAVKAINKLETEKEGLNKDFIIKEQNVDKNTYTPMLKRYKEFPFKITAKELIEYMIAESDNNACDIFLEYIGGAKELEKYLHSLGFRGVEISVSEAQMWADIQNEYKNKAYPLDVVNVIKTVYEGDILPVESKKFLVKSMIKTVTGRNKLKAGLPPGAVTGHKTGSSSRKPDGVKIADNDAGFVILPDNSVYYIAVFVTESKMGDKENAELIAKISNIVYRYIADKKPVYSFI